MEVTHGQEETAFVGSLVWYIVDLVRTWHDDLHLVDGEASLCIAGLVLTKNDLSLILILFFRVIHRVRDYSVVFLPGHGLRLVGESRSSSYDHEFRATCPGKINSVEARVFLYGAFDR